MNVIEVKNLTKDYGSGRGVFDVSLEVKEKEVFGFLGPNGAGKSTTIRHLMGFSKPDSGNTFIFGKPSFKAYSEILKHVGYIPGEIALPQGLTGWEFLRMMQDLQGVHDEERLNYLLDLFKLNPEGETKRMSLGVKRKLAIVAAFMNDPQVLILDEPTSGLDPVMQYVFIDFIKKEKERGKTILLSSHIFSEVDATCDRIAIIKDGKIMSNFIANDLKHSKEKQYTLTFKTKEDLLSFKGKLQDSKLVYEDLLKLKLSLYVNDAKINDFIKLISEYDLSDFTHEILSLEDYFMSYYKEEKDYKGAL